MPATATLRGALYVARCAGSAVIAFIIARAVALPFPVWAAVSAVVVAQADMRKTLEAIGGRMLGTVIGVCIAIAVELALRRFALDVASRIGAAVTIGAAISYWYPAVRVCMWTSLIVIVTRRPEVPVELAGYYRGSEVMIGVLISGALSLVEARLPWSEAPRSSDT